MLGTTSTTTMRIVTVITSTFSENQYKRYVVHCLAPPLPLRIPSLFLLGSHVSARVTLLLPS